jgi:hypothetical protein
MQGKLVGKVGDLVEVPVVVLRIVMRQGWKPTVTTTYGRTQDGKQIRRDLYVMKDRTGSIYTITMPQNGAFKNGEEFILKGNIKSCTMFCGNKQVHISPWSLVLKQRNK